MYPAVCSWRRTTRAFFFPSTRSQARSIGKAELTVIEIVIVGRGGQGGVTLAKLVAGIHFSKGRHVQAFGSYGAERSGAPIKAFIRIDDREIVSRNQIYEPDDVIVLDPALITPVVATGLKPPGWLLLNSPDAPSRFYEWFAGYRIATVDATSIALSHTLGTRTTPIVNTTMLGAIGRVFDLGPQSVQEALAESGFTGANLAAAREAYERVRIGPQRIVSSGAVRPPTRPQPSGVSVLDRAGGPPDVKTGTWAKQRPRLAEFPSPCTGQCPAGNDVRGFLLAAKHGDFELAATILYRTSPFPAVCGRVCPGPCETVCQRSGLDGSVLIREIERFVADHAALLPVGSEPRRDRVAVIGSGPTGLSAAYQLRRRGYRVDLYEQGDQLGGLMRSGIPAYRLPSEVLDRELSRILDQGTTVTTGVRVGPSELDEIARGCAAVFVATGLQARRGLGLGEGRANRVVQGLEFLARARQGLTRVDGEDVIVIGGGNTAIDAARSALRLGARSVRILYRRTRAEMPAMAEELLEAVEEGVHFEELIAPVDCQETESSLLLGCTRVRLGERDASGRRQPVADGAGGRFELECSRMILALGAAPDLALTCVPGLPEGAVGDLGEGTVHRRAGTPMLLGGDLVTRAGTVAAAITSGRRAAEQIHALLSGEIALDRTPPVSVGAPRVHCDHFELCPPELPARLGPRRRIGDFAEVHAGYAANQAAREVARCFVCGACTGCDICRAHCPEGIVTRGDDGTRFDYDYCKGCGICAQECPRGAVVMEQI